MQIERRALYNLMRMNWILDPGMAAEPWQVEDYRIIPLDILFERLGVHDIRMDRYSFVEFADHCDTPEDLTDELLSEDDADATTQDQIYLIIFEMWRRLLPQKPCLSVFCDELDHQIHMYDSGNTKSVEEIQDSIANLQVVLDENVDQGGDPLEVFESVCAGCANDIEAFLYDYIDEQIDNENPAYASEMLDGFSDYVQDIKWFDFLKARLVALNDHETAGHMGEMLAVDAMKVSDLEFNLELLAFFVQAGSEQAFVGLVKKTLPLLQHEEDFQDLLNICVDFYHRLDIERKEDALQKLQRKRSHLHPEGIVNPKDPHFIELISILS